MKAIILGTSSVFPTKERNHAAVLLRYGGEGLLFDCGEGTQRQIRIAGENPMKINRIFITHWHGDHSIGVSGLLESMAMNQGKQDVAVYGPEGTKKKIKALMEVFNIHPKYNLEVVEVNIKKEEIIAETPEYWVRAAPMSHAVPCVAYVFEEKPHVKINIDYVAKFGLKDHDIIENLRSGKNIKHEGKVINAKKATFTTLGKKFAYVMDTSAVPEIVGFVHGADVLVCESTFLNVLKEAADERGHMTAKQAAKIAKSAGVKELILTHFSQRYKDVEPLLKEARKVFGNARLAKDFLEITL